MFEAQTCPAIIIPTGTFSPVAPSILQSNSYIRTTQSTSLPSSLTTADPLKIIKLDAHPSNGYVLLNPGFSATPITGAFIAQAYDGCGPNTPARMAEDSLSSTDDLKIEIFPNPSDAIFNVKIGNLNDGTLEVFSVLGVKIYESNFFNNSTSEIDLSRYPSQMYFIKITSGENVFYKTILKS